MGILLCKECILKHKVKNPEDALKNAKYIKKKLLEGENFKELAKTFSDLPSAEDGGDIGTFTKEEMSPFMQETILSMHPGEISPILETPTGYQILKLLSSQTGDWPISIALADVKEERDILKKALAIFSKQDK